VGGVWGGRKGNGVSHWYRGKGVFIFMVDFENTVESCIEGGGKN